MMSAKGKQLAIWGVVLQLGCPIGIAFSVVGMVRAFSEMSRSGKFYSPETLASNISLGLYASFIGGLISLVGAVLLSITLFGVKYRASWFRTAMWIISVLWLLNIPLGTILGIIVMVYLSNHKAEFVQLAEPSAVPANEV